MRLFLLLPRPRHGLNEKNVMEGMHTDVRAFSSGSPSSNHMTRAGGTEPQVSHCRCCVFPADSGAASVVICTVRGFTATHGSCMTTSIVQSRNTSHGAVPWGIKYKLPPKKICFRAMTKMVSSETDLVGKDMRFHTENAGILLTARSVMCTTTYRVTVLVRPFCSAVLSIVVIPVTLQNTLNSG